MIPVMYGNNYQIFQTPGFVVITYEIIHEARVIPLTSRPHVGAGVRPYMGDARGRWEGNTLVVETTNFTRRRLSGRGPATLRYRAVHAGVAAAIDWTATIEDPRPGPAVDDCHAVDAHPRPVMPFECHEGNYGMVNILSGARADDKAASKWSGDGMSRTNEPVPHALCPASAGPWIGFGR